MPASLAPREILGAAWPLFKACLPVCLPLAIVGVAAGATPGSEAAMSGARSLAYTREWWGLTFASIVLTLVCYGGVLRWQLVLAQGRPRPPLLECIRQAAVDVPFVLVLLLLMLLPLLPAMLVTAWRGFWPWGGLLTLAALLLLIHAWFAWPALVAGDIDAEQRNAGAAGAPKLRPRAPLAALSSSLALVRGRWPALLQLAGTLLAAVLVFVLLTGIFLGLIMGLAGQSTPTPGGLALSRWLMALMLAVPVVYGGAVTVTIWRRLNAASTAP
jgi:hypothetical protein|nr:MAG: hypothetical protein DIU62_09505 [Pseudomonadota bacterium]